MINIQINIRVRQMRILTTFRFRNTKAYRKEVKVCGYFKLKKKQFTKNF